jgi:Spy/CpxP family protein refolding chaperone
MTDETRPPVEGQTPEPTVVTRRRGFKTPFLLVGAVALGLTAGAAATAFGNNGPGFGGWGGGPWMHHGGFRGGPMDPAQIDDFVERGVKHLAVEIDATDEQQTKLVAIAQSLARDLVPMREDMREAGGELRDLLIAPTVDRTAIETFRAEQVANADAMSKRVAQAVADAAEMLTPEQRQKVGDLSLRFGGDRWGPRFH